MSFTAELDDGWDMFLLFEAEWNEWGQEPGSLRKALLTTILGNHVLDWTWYRNCGVDPLPTFVTAMNVTTPGEAGYGQFCEAIFKKCGGTRKLRDIANGAKHAYLSKPKSKPIRNFHAGISASRIPPESFPDFSPEQALDLQQFTFLSISARLTDKCGHETIEDIGPVLKEVLDFWRSFYENLPHRASSQVLA